MCICVCRNLAEWDTEPCQQSLKLLDSRGGVLHHWVCNDNMPFQRTRTAVAENYLTVVLENNYTIPTDWRGTEGGGAYMFAFQCK